MIQWSDELAIGDARIDSERRYLVDFVTIVEQASPYQRQRAIGKSTLIELRKRLEVLFDHENQLMAATKFIQAKQHALEHKVMLTALREIIEEFDDMKVNKAINFLDTWVTSHLQNQDLAFAEFMRHSQPSGAPRPHR